MHTDSCGLLRSAARFDLPIVRGHVGWTWRVRARATSQSDVTLPRPDQMTQRVATSLERLGSIKARAPHA